MVYRADLYTIPGLGGIAGQVLSPSVCVCGCVCGETVLKKNKETSICTRYLPLAPPPNMDPGLRCLGNDSLSSRVTLVQVLSLSTD